jgi:hypothetical protein
MAGGNIEILSPPDKVSVEGKLINIVCRIKGYQEGNDDEIS